MRSGRCVTRVAMRRYSMEEQRYTDDNTREPHALPYSRVLVSPSAAQAARARHVATQVGLLQVGRHERLAARFKAVEEAKWTRKEKKTRASAVKATGAAESTPAAAAAAALDGSESRELLERLKGMPQEELLREDWLQAALDAVDPTREHHVLDPDGFRVGVLGLSHQYFAEDHGSWMYKKQVYDGVFGSSEEEGVRLQTRIKMRGVLEQFGLLPSATSPLWHTADLQAWHRWLRTGVEPSSAGAPNPWANVSLAQVAQVVAGTVTEGWAPGALDAASSEAEWQRRARLTATLQDAVGQAAERPEIEWTSRSYWEPSWTTDAARVRWRERKVSLSVRVASLGLPEVVRQRLVALLGPRYHDGCAVVTTDRYPTKEENRLHSLLLMRSLLTESWSAHPRFVRVNETRALLVKQHNSAAREALLARAAQPSMEVFRFQFQ